MALSNVKVTNVAERPKLVAGNKLVPYIFISIETSFGSTGTLEIPALEAENLSDDELAGRIAAKAATLDKAHLL